MALIVVFLILKSFSGLFNPKLKRRVQRYQRKLIFRPEFAVGMNTEKETDHSGELSKDDSRLQSDEKFTTAAYRSGHWR